MVIKVRRKSCQVSANIKPIRLSETQRRGRPIMKGYEMGTNATTLITVEKD